MKIKIFLWLILFSLMMTSCFEDESAKDVEFLHPIVINDFSIPLELYTTQGGRLKVTTLSYKEDMDDLHLKFQWLLMGGGQHIILGNSMILDTVINVPMSRDAYSLVYTVTDTINDLKLSKRYLLYVTGQYEAGLLVADTKDEQTSDIHLIVGMNFNRNYKVPSDDHIFRDVYSINNGSKVNGLITGMKTLVSYDYLQANIVTKNTVEDLNPLDNFKTIRKNNEMFIKPFKGEMVVGSIQECSLIPCDVIAVNGHIHKRYQNQEATTFGVNMLLEDLTDDYYITEYKYRSGRPYPSEGDIFGVAFDKKNRRFLAFPFFREEDNFRIFRNKSTDGKLDPNKLGNKDCIYMGYGSNTRLFSVLKDNDIGTYEIWAFNLNSDDGSKRPNIIPEHYVLDGCTDIEKAHTFQSQTMEEVMYYATDERIYAALLTTEHPVAFPRYYANLGEKITGMQLIEYCEGKMLVPNAAKPGENTLQTSRNRMMLVYTYNESTLEGKVIAVPLMSLGTGDLILDKKYHQMYGPFGRILETTCYHTR